MFTTLRSFSLVRVAATTATALLFDGAPDYDHNIEHAIQFGQLAASIAESHPELVDLPGRVAVLTNLSTAFLKRRQGDPDWKLAQAESYLNQTLVLLEEADDHNGSGIVHNNFGLLLTNRGESGDIERAVEHHRVALTHRTRHRDPTDWATSQLNLGFAYSRLGAGDGVKSVRSAILHTARARYVARALQETQLITLTEHNLAAQQRQLSEMDEIPIEEQSRLLMRAEVSGHEAVKLIPSAEDPLRFGQAWLNLGQILLASGQKRDSMRAFERALSALSTDQSPADARTASRHLMALAMDLAGC